MVQAGLRNLVHAPGRKKPLHLRQEGTGLVSYAGTFANSILMRDFGALGVVSMGTMICQAATVTGVCLTRSGCSGFLSEISSAAMPKSRLRVFLVVSSAVSISSLNST